MLKIVFVGAGWFANHVHGPALAHYAREHPGEVDLAAVCVRKSVDKAEAFCREFGFQRVYTDLEEMLDKEKPGACWVVTPIEQTRRVAGLMMERNLPVLLEKPPGASLAEARELAELSRRTGTPNQVAFNRRWAPGTRRAISWAREHGPVEYIYARMLRLDRMDETFAYGTGIHLLDCVRCLGEPTLGSIREAKTVRVRSNSGTNGTNGTRNGTNGTVGGRAGHGSGTQSERFSERTERKTERSERETARSERHPIFNFHVDLTFASGVRGRCDILPACGKLAESYTLYTPLKTITCSLPWSAGTTELDGKAELWVKGEVVESEAYAFDPPHLSNGVYGEAEAFITALKEGRKPSPSAEEAVDSVALAEAVQAGRDMKF